MTTELRAAPAPRSANIIDHLDDICTAALLAPDSAAKNTALRLVREGLALLRKDVADKGDSPDRERHARD